jgi:hypothetical protein
MGAHFQPREHLHLASMRIWNCCGIILITITACRPSVWHLTLECHTNAPASIVFKQFLFPSPECGKCHCNWLEEDASSWLGEECCFDCFRATEFGVCHSHNWDAGSSLGDECQSNCLLATGEQWEWKWLGIETGGSGVLLHSWMGGKSECSSHADSTCVWWGESSGWE